MKKLRAKLGLSRRELARALNICERTVQRWEDDEASPSGLAADVINAIEDAIAGGVSARDVGRMMTQGIRNLLTLQFRAGA